ncbi:hypothetical protein AURDEDRAFT_116783, partial [Auricularia subglabra TFB-10046 SS5]
TLSDYAVDVAEHLFADAQLTELADNTPLACATNCSEKGFAFASVDNRPEFYRGSNLARLVTPRPVSDCYMQCPGDAASDAGPDCGGPRAAPKKLRPTRGSAHKTPQDSFLVQSAWAALHLRYSNPPTPPTPRLGWRTAYGCAQTGSPPLLEDMNMLHDKLWHLATAGGEQERAHVAC